MQARAAAQQGRAQRQAAEIEAQQQEAHGRAELANASRETERLHRASERLRGRQSSLLAASGFSTSDRGSGDFLDATTQQATIQELLMIAQGREAMGQDMYGAQVSRWRGRNAERAGRMEATTTLVNGLSDWSRLYGGGGGGGRTPKIPTHEWGHY